ncbi:MAG: c-type cytochrome, partial [Nitriliruptorales bacterium]|nr:c-type cytochrome [Nitriliruptorales bacterium]
SLAVGLQAWLADPADAQAEQRGAAEEQPLVDGELLWKRDCASCHGADGNGTANGPSLQGKGPAGVHFTVTTGRMPMELLAPLGDEPFDADRLQVLPNERGATEYLPAQVAALTEYSREILTGPDVPPVDIATADMSHGQELFQTNCASCHVWSGRGGTLADGHVATTLERSTPENVVAAMRIGIGTMPVFSEATISEEEANDIAAYVKYLQTPRNPGGYPLAYVGPAGEGFVAWVVGLFGILLLTRWIGGKP